MRMFLFEETTVSWFILHLFAFNHAHNHNMQDLGILEANLGILELDLRIRGRFGLSPALRGFQYIFIKPISLLQA